MVFEFIRLRLVHGSSLQGHFLKQKVKDFNNMVFQFNGLRLVHIMDILLEK
jgi:hypothetical protein